jgi:hypothetical protein
MTNNPSSTSTLISLRIAARDLAAIDEAAKRAGQDRNAYIRSWIPEIPERDKPRHRPTKPL